MATSVFFNRVNIEGIPCFKSDTVTESAAAVTIGFGTPVILERRFSGVIAVKITTAPEATAAALPVFFSMGSSTLPLLGEEGTQAVGADIFARVYLLFYDREANALQLIG